MVPGLHREWTDPELDVAQLRRGEQAAREEGDVGKHVVPNVLYLVRRSANGGDAGGDATELAKAQRGPRRMNGAETHHDGLYHRDVVSRRRRMESGERRLPVGVWKEERRLASPAER